MAVWRCADVVRPCRSDAKAQATETIFLMIDCILVIINNSSKVRGVGGVDRSASRAVVRLVAASAAVLARVVALDRSDEVSIGCMFAVMN